MPPTARLRPHEKKNRALWDKVAVRYERTHAKTLSRNTFMGWGVWHRAESELQVLGGVRGRDVLELGCGAGRWAVALAQRGARVTALDLSPARLRQARAEMLDAGLDFPLLEASAEAVPLPSKSQDIVFCDWGALTFADPYRSVPEAARLLRPGGLLAFLTASPFRSLCLNRTTDRLSRRLQYDYFDLHREEYRDEVNFNLPYGEWIRLFRANSLVVEDLIELPPPPHGRTTYVSKTEAEWARHWPTEVIWRARKTREPWTAGSGSKLPRRPPARRSKNRARARKS
jgi:ubiquinone/menaquinone biosynthesis C-methylase UbiE